MKKIYLVIAGALLIILVITTMLLSLVKKPVINTEQNSAFPTGVPLPETANRQVAPNSTSTENNDQGLSGSSFDVSTLPSVETNDFKIQFSSQLNKVVVEKKTPDAEQKFSDWATQNNYPQLIDNPDKVLLLLPGQAPPDTQPLLDFLNIFMNFGQQSGSSTPSNPSTPSLSNNTPTPGLKSVPSINLLKVYYAQCGDQGNLPLPDGCNLCSAGCGAVSVSMITSSYLGKQYDPKYIVQQYQSKGYLLGCSGSRYSDAHSLLESLGLKTTDYLIFNSEKSDTVVPQLRKYLNAGWTFFTLASFCSGGCGHYFWITDIDAKGNIWAYDPAYGRYQIPYNENSRYPYPLYRLAFGVKK